MIVVIRYKRNGKVDPPDPQICPCFLKVYNHRESEKGVSRICNLFLSYSCHVALLSAARQHSYIESIMYRCTLQHFHSSNFCTHHKHFALFIWIFLVIPSSLPRGCPRKNTDIVVRTPQQLHEMWHSAGLHHSLQDYYVCEQVKSMISSPKIL